MEFGTAGLEIGTRFRTMEEPGRISPEGDQFFKLDG